MKQFGTRVQQRLKQYTVRGRWLLHLASRAVIGAIAIAAVRVFRRADRRRMANFFGPLMRTVGPWLREHRIGRENLARPRCQTVKFAKE